MERKTKNKRKEKEEERYKDMTRWKKCRELVESYFARKAEENREEKAK